MKIFLAAFSALLWAAVAQAACKTNLVVDNYANFAANDNSLGEYTSHDGTCAGVKADIANKKITFTSLKHSYFYTTFACEMAILDGYNAITFPIKGPVGANFTVELQTSRECVAPAWTRYYTRYFTTVPGMTGAVQTITLPLKAFLGANLNAINAIAFQSFSINGAWEIGQIQLVCANQASTPMTMSTSSTKIKIATSPTKGVTSTSSGKPESCPPYVIEDFSSQVRLTSLFLNSILQSTSDDGTMKALPSKDKEEPKTSVIVAKNRVTLTPANSASYWYTELGCLKATKIWTGITMTINAPAGTTFTVELITDKSCSNFLPNMFGDKPILIDVTTKDLGWTFDGKEKSYTIPFSKFPGLDTDNLDSVLFKGLSGAITLGPIGLSCN